MATKVNGTYTGKVAFVTGAGGGIGRATALTFAREGASVVVADVSEQANQQTACMIEELGGRIVQKEDWVPMGLRRQSDHMRSGGGHARKNKNIGTRSLQDRDMPIDKLVQHIKGDIDNDQAGQIAESFLNSLEEVPPKLVVLPKLHDVALRIEGLDVVGVDAPLGTKRRLPAHGPRKRLRVAQLLGARGNEELGNLPLV